MAVNRPWRERRKAAQIKTAPRCHQRRPANRRNEAKRRSDFMRTAILVLGMHRSGTSALTRCIALCGSALPLRLMEPAVCNETGFWEPREIVALHDEILAAAGSAWDDLLEIDQSWFHSDLATSFRDRLVEAITEDYADATQFVVKDPRLCRLLPLWKSALAQLGIKLYAVILLRHPLEVAASLAKRDKFEINRSQMLWLRYLLDAERASRDLPRYFLTYDSLLADPVISLERLASALHFSWHRPPSAAAADLAAFLSPELRHHQVGTDGESTWNAGNPDVKSAWCYLRALADDNASNDLSPLDAIAARISAGESIFGSAIRALQNELVRARDEARELCEQLQSHHSPPVSRSPPWLCKLVEILPKEQHFFLRNIVRVIYWAITPHRIPERIALLRQHQSSAGKATTHTLPRPATENRRSVSTKA